MSKLDSLIKEVELCKSISNSFKNKFIQLIQKSVDDQTPSEMREMLLDEAIDTWHRHLKHEKTRIEGLASSHEINQSSLLLKHNLKILEETVQDVLQNTAKILLTIKLPDKNTLWH